MSFSVRHVLGRDWEVYDDRNGSVYAGGFDTKADAESVADDANANLKELGSFPAPKKKGRRRK